MPWVWLAGAISLEVVATLNLKVSEGFTRFWPSVVVVLGYVGSFSLLGATLKRIDVGTVYAIWSGAGTVVVVFVGIMLFGESATGSRLIGIGVITVGVIVLNLSGGGHSPDGGTEAKTPPDEPQSEPGVAAGRHATGRGTVTESMVPMSAFIPAPRPGRHVAPPRTTTVAAFAPSPTGRRAARLARTARAARTAQTAPIAAAAMTAVTAQSPTQPRGVPRVPAPRAPSSAFPSDAATPAAGTPAVGRPGATRVTNAMGAEARTVPVAHIPTQRRHHDLRPSPYTPRHHPRKDEG